MSAAPVLEIAGVVKSYGALRPLRLQALTLAPGERVTIAGLDATAAELFVNLVTGASLPEAGHIRNFGRRTADITDADEWLGSLDRFGIVTERGVLLEGATLAQNLALPFSLEIDPIPAAVRQRVAALAEECGIASDWLEQPAGGLPAVVKARTHLARAIALGPALLLLEHPTASLDQADRTPFGLDAARVCETRTLSAVALCADDEFGAAFAHRSLTLTPATGALVAQKRRWLW